MRRPLAVAAIAEPSGSTLIAILAGPGLIAWLLLGIPSGYMHNHEQT
jgi:hypothetical protein